MNLEWDHPQIIDYSKTIKDSSCPFWHSKNNGRNLMVTFCAPMCVIIYAGVQPSVGNMRKKHSRNAVFMRLKEVQN